MQRSETFFEQGNSVIGPLVGTCLFYKCVLYFFLARRVAKDGGEGLYCSTHRYTQHATTSSMVHVYWYDDCILYERIYMRNEILAGVLKLDIDAPTCLHDTYSRETSNRYRIGESSEDNDAPIISTCSFQYLSRDWNTGQCATSMLEAAL